MMHDFVGFTSWECTTIFDTKDLFRVGHDYGCVRLQPETQNANKRTSTWDWQFEDGAILFGIQNLLVLEAIVGAGKRKALIDIQNLERAGRGCGWHHCNNNPKAQKDSRGCGIRHKKYTTLTSKIWWKLATCVGTHDCSKKAREGVWSRGVHDMTNA